MTLVRNPFDAGGYSLAEMTQAINILPNLYTRLAQIGLFRFEGVSQRSVIIEQYEGVLSLLPSVPLGGPATVGTREGRSMRSFALPWIPHDDVVLPADIQGQPALGAFDAADPLVEVMNRKLLLMRRKHAQTREYMEMNALRGIVKDGAEGEVAADVLAQGLGAGRGIELVCLFGLGVRDQLVEEFPADEGVDRGHGLAQQVVLDRAQHLADLALHVRACGAEDEVDGALR